MARASRIPSLGRRRLLVGAAASAASLLLDACGTSAPPTPTPVSVTTPQATRLSIVPATTAAASVPSPTVTGVATAPLTIATAIPPAPPGATVLERVLSIDAAANRLGSVSSFAPGPDGNIYVGEYTGGVKVFAPDGTFIRKWGAQGKGDGEFVGVTGIGFDTQGNIYTVDFGNVRIQVFEKTGTFLRAFNTEQPVGPVGTGLDPAGNIYVANAHTCDHYVQKYASDGRLLLGWGHTGEFGEDSNNQTGRLAVDGAGNVYIPDFANGRILKFDGNGKSQGSIGQHGQGEDQFGTSGPGGVAVDVNGYIYATDNGNIVKFDPQGQFVVRWVGATGAPSGKFASGAGVRVDGLGNIYIKDVLDGGIIKFRQR